MPRSFFYFQMNEFIYLLVIHQFLVTKNKLFWKELTEMDRLFSYASSYELQNPDPDRKFGIRIQISNIEFVEGEYYNFVWILEFRLLLGKYGIHPTEATQCLLLIPRQQMQKSVFTALPTSSQSIRDAACSYSVSQAAFQFYLHGIAYSFYEVPLRFLYNAASY